jgi:hypothetical protein
VLVSLGLVAAGGLLYAVAAPPMDVLGVQFGGASQPLPLPEATGPAVLWDFGFIAGYSVSLWTAARLARATFRSPVTRAAAWAAGPLALVAASADVVENVLLLRVVHSSDPSATRPLLDVVTAAATVKFACLVPSAAVGYTAVARTGRRLWHSRPSANAVAATDESAGSR